MTTEKRLNDLKKVKVLHAHAKMAIKGGASDFIGIDEVDTSITGSGDGTNIIIEDMADL